MITKEDFLADNQGARFIDVMEDSRIDFNKVIDFFNRDEIRVRLSDSEDHHDRPALAGVIREFESQEQIDFLFCNYDAHTTVRFRQCIGVLVRLHMEQMGWRRTGRKGSLGTREKISPTNEPGTYKNKQGISTWFTRAERYEKIES